MQRKRLSYANVTATLALAAALGTGGAWAANSIHGSELKNGTVRGKKLVDNTVRGKQIKESSLGKVPDARDADTLDGIGSNGFVRGRGLSLAGHDTSFGGGPPGPSNVIKSIATPVGRFELGCSEGGTGNADVRYRNTTAGPAEVVRTVGSVDTDAIGPEAPDDTDYDLVDEPSGNAQGVGYAVTEADGPKRIELRVGKGARAAVFTAFARRSGDRCSWTWDFVSGSG